MLSVARLSAVSIRASDKRLSVPTVIKQPNAARWPYSLRICRSAKLRHSLRRFNLAGNLCQAG
jgi:hypothetical protein